jgi:hypothetical protein
MSTHEHSILTDLVAICPETHIEVFSAQVLIFYGIERGYEATWSDPGQGDVVQFGYVKHREGKNDPFRLTYSLGIKAWAENWLEDHEDEAIEAANEQDADDRAEARASFDDRDGDNRVFGDPT